LDPVSGLVKGRIRESIFDDSMAQNPQHATTGVWGTPPTSSDHLLALSLHQMGPAGRGAKAADAKIG